jgi:hypothetical protein
MTKKERNRVLIFCGISIVLGITLPFSNVIYFLFLFIACIITGLISIVLILAGFFANRQLIKKGMIGLLAVCLFLMVGLGLETLIRHQKYKIALGIITKIETFRLKNARYPKTLDEIGNVKTIRGLRYNLYDSMRQFRIEYFMDGFNREYYNSETKDWETLGWND